MYASTFLFAPTLVHVLQSVSSKGSGLMYVVWHKRVSTKKMEIKAQGIVDVVAHHRFRLLTANFFRRT